MIKITRDILTSLRRLGGIRDSVRRLGIVKLLDSGVREIWLRCGMRVLGSGKFEGGQRYGLWEAFLFPACDYWVRYAFVIGALAEIKLVGPVRLLEVSSGRGGIAWFLRESNFRVCLVDSVPELLQDSRGGKAWRVCADAARLPFTDGSFDVVVSVDTFEHIPKEHRPAFTSELKRITKNAVILTCPLDSEDGDFRAHEYDSRLLRDINRRHAAIPDWLQDHMDKGHPSPEELSHSFPEAQIRGTQNGDEWLEYAKRHQHFLGWLTASIYYRDAIQHLNPSPPYCRGVLLWKKPLGATTIDPVSTPVGVESYENIAT